MLASDLPKLRVKRQSSGGKYTDAAQMPQVKVLRLWLQMLRNLWSPVYVGGAHPFHHEIPKPVVQLWREKIETWFFPKVGDEAKKD
ncbi:hypothetical protein ABMA28_006902 [Loxostege sticticalis]|uniref:Uncharacterized protein n=1 Tax=Loxostege sticticalis TaxID=481309 RepID=A0ABD0TNT9_LOXSC